MADDPLFIPQDDPAAVSNWQGAIDPLRDVGAQFHLRGWSLGTSSNYSVVLGRNPVRLLITASGKDKRSLQRGDFVVVDGAGKAIHASHPNPAAETLLHTVVAETTPGVGAVLHTHSVWGTLLSDLFHEAGGFAIEGYEMLKGLDGVTTHEHREWVPIVENTQDIAAMAKEIRPKLLDPARPFRHGFLIRRHGLYTWGRDLAEARRHIEIYEFLFEVVARRLTLTGR
ncbi:MAG: methylthioribulose 1-phosphate dehydratase, partial [Planctomycetia bacterium]